MNKIVYNTCYGGFWISTNAVDWLEKNGSENTKSFIKKRTEFWKNADNCMYSDPKECVAYDVSQTLKRHNKGLVAVVEALGELASFSKYSKIKIMEIEDNDYRIDNYDGVENIIEKSKEKYIHID